MAIQTALLLGFAGGLILALIISLFTDRISGELRIDHANPDKDIYCFIFYDDVDLSAKKRVIVKVNNVNFTQK